ncbi:carboxylesterase family protein [uncultured Corynebacterium sp.]|uniref:carboxylesterase family protein n=1 Tax=uncultured Corynebacterium sp. TaxID=159447 RepID=UPI0025E67E83|nr:carboxylesterase family protein [uncultured Corynebacterium sp.]
MAEPVPPQFTTPYGRVSGSSRDGVSVFRAVPVAHTGHFDAPEGPEPWEGILCCADTRERRNLRLPTTVSVFAPRDARALPVIAWIHGGRYEEGHGDDGWYDGTALAASGCVVVTLNYRKCLEGFLPLDGDAPGSFRGVDDLVHQLRWIRDAVSRVGGDPSNVTLAGQSAGGGLVMALLTDRRADDLFHRAMVLSPGLPRILPRVGWSVRRAVARMCLGSRLTREKVGQLSTARRTRAYRRMSLIYSADCALGPGPLDLGELREVPLLVSTMEDEFVRFPGVCQLDRAVARAGLPSWVMVPGMRLLGVPRRKLAGWCRYVGDDRPMGRTVGDTMIRRWASGLLEAMPGDRVWACEFRGGSWRGQRIDAQHCGELPLLFGTLEVGRRLVAETCGPDARERLTDLGARYRSSVLAFAHGEGPGWEPFGGDRSARVFSLLGEPDTGDRNIYGPLRSMIPV